MKDRFQMRRKDVKNIQTKTFQGDMQMFTTSE